ncbi:MAG: hypothetical protein ACI4C3_02080 [Bacteroides sp.]
MKTFRQLAMGLLALMICIALPSCSDDDDENEKNEAVLEEQKGMVELLNLQMNLCVMNLKGEPTEATFGIPVSQTNTAERIYYTKNLDSAKKRYQLLFHSDTQRSEDGCTYTLANKQGTATFAETNGNKGELAVATFDVPGLKGLVKKVHFIDYTQRGQNSSGDKFSQLVPGNIVAVKLDENTERYGIAMGPLKGSDDTWVLFTPSIQKEMKNYDLTGFIDQTMIDDNSAKINLMDYFKSYSKEEFDKFSNSVWDFLFWTECAGDGIANLDFVEDVYCEYWQWGGWRRHSYFFQVQNTSLIHEYSFDYHNVLNRTTKLTYNRYHMLLDRDGYDTRTSLWNIKTTVVTNYSVGDTNTTTTEDEFPREFEGSLTLWTTVSTVTKGDDIEILQ